MGATSPASADRSLSESALKAATAALSGAMSAKYCWPASVSVMGEQSEST